MCEISHVLPGVPRRMPVSCKRDLKLAGKKNAGVKKAGMEMFFEVDASTRERYILLTNGINVMLYKYLT